MTQEQIDMAVAQATGESRAEIRRRGFSLLNPDFGECDAVSNDRGSHYVDWDQLARERVSLFP